MFNAAYEAGGPPARSRPSRRCPGSAWTTTSRSTSPASRSSSTSSAASKITTDKPIDDAKSHLKLAAGTHILNGEQALGLVRTRKSIGDGSDLGRIQLQQAFIKALIKQVKSVGVFSNPKKLFDLADTATKAITPDSRLDSVNEPHRLRGRPQGPRPPQDIR